MMAATTVMHVGGWVYELDGHQPLFLESVQSSAYPLCKSRNKNSTFPQENGDPQLQHNIVLQDPGRVSRSYRIFFFKVALIIYNNKSSFFWISKFSKHYSHYFIIIFIAMEQNHNILNIQLKKKCLIIK